MNNGQNFQPASAVELIPPVQDLRERLAVAMREVRTIRELLRVAERASRLRSITERREVQHAR